MATARERAREAMVADIVDEARRQLARDGAAGLSLRAVARELGVVSSAVYRYVASRDELLTLLISEGYERLADAVERAESRAGPDPRDRWRAACRAVRSWAHTHPHEYALLYGTPVPGYAAPATTIGPARRLYAALVGPVARAPHPRPRRRSQREVSPALAANAATVASELGLDAGPELVLELLGAVAGLFGLVSFELFGHTTNVIDDHDTWFDDRVESMADALLGRGT